MIQPVYPIRLIAVDLDGTLLNSHHQMSAANEAALKAAMARGIQIVIATGKTRTSAIPILARLGLETPGVFLQGLALYDQHGALTHQITLDPDVVREVALIADANTDITPVAYSGARIFVPRHDEFSEALVVRYGEPTPEAVGSFLSLTDLPINKMMFAGVPLRVRAVRAELAERLHGRAALVQSLSTPTAETVEILPFGASKGAGLRMLLGDLGVAPEHVLALGDNENDIEMIQLAGIGVAMGNAAPRVREAADYITETNDNDGVAAAVQRFVLEHPTGA